MILTYCCWVEYDLVLVTLFWYYGQRWYNIWFSRHFSGLTCHVFCLQAPSPSDIVASHCQTSPEDCASNSGDGTVHSSSGRGSNSRWSTLSWDAPSDLLSPPTPDPGGTVHLDSDSRPSSGKHTCTHTPEHFSGHSTDLNSDQHSLSPSDKNYSSACVWEGPLNINRTLFTFVCLHCVTWLWLVHFSLTVNLSAFVAKLLSSHIVTLVSGSTPNSGIPLSATQSCMPSFMHFFTFL